MREKPGLLGRLSNEIAARVAEASSALASFPDPSGGRVSGFSWNPGVFVAGPRAEGDWAVISDNRIANVARFDPGCQVGFTVFRTAASARHGVALPPAREPARVGAFALALGAGADGTPTAQLMLVSHAGTAGVRLDRTLDPSAEGGPVLDSQGGLLGMALAAPDGGCVVLDRAAIANILDDPRPGWIGVSFQPTLVPAALRERTGQDSARLVVRLAHGGPAENAGLVVGDTLLTLDGVGLTGTGALRGFLAEARPGRRVAARLVRHGRIETTTLVVGAEPDRH